MLNQVGDLATNLNELTTVAKKILLRVMNLEEHRDAHVNRIMNLEQQLAMLQEKFDAHLELYHSAE